MEVGCICESNDDEVEEVETCPVGWDEDELELRLGWVYAELCIEGKDDVGLEIVSW